MTATTTMAAAKTIAIQVLADRERTQIMASLQNGARPKKSFKDLINLVSPAFRAGVYTYSFLRMTFLNELLSLNCALSA